MNITSIDGNWVKGTVKLGIRFFAFSAKIYPEPTRNYGITDPTGEGHISKLSVTDERSEEMVINYDRGWDINETSFAPEIIDRLEAYDVIGKVERELAS